MRLFFFRRTAVQDAAAAAAAAPNGGQDSDLSQEDTNRRSMDMLAGSVKTSMEASRVSTELPPSAGSSVPAPSSAENGLLAVPTAPSNASSSSLSSTGGGTKRKKRDFQQVIIKSVMQLLLIQTVGEILAPGSGTTVYATMRARDLMTLAECLHKSYLFAKKFNDDMELRVALYKAGAFFILLLYTRSCSMTRKRVLIRFEVFLSDN
jgi:hypothetical protein